MISNQKALIGATLAQHVYADHSAGAEVVVAGHTYEVIDSLSKPDSGYHGTLYLNRDTGEYVFSHRGSDDIKDWYYSNSAIALGVPALQEYDAREFVDDMLEQYPYANQASHVGHSLGGYLAKTMAIETQNDAIAFNAPDVRDDTNNIETIQEGQISTFNIVGDPLSAQIVNDIGEVYLVNASTVEGKLAQGIVLADDLDRTGLTKDTGSLFHLHGMLEIVNTFQNNEDNYVLGYEIAVNPESRLISVQLVDGHAITDALQLKHMQMTLVQPKKM